MADLKQMITAFVNTPNWSDAEAYLKAHEAALLDVASDDLFAALIAAQPDEDEAQVLRTHHQIIRDARHASIEAAFARRRPAPETPSAETDMARFVARLRDDIAQRGAPAVQAALVEMGMPAETVAALLAAARGAE